MEIALVRIIFVFCQITIFKNPSWKMDRTYKSSPETVNFQSEWYMYTTLHHAASTSNKNLRTNQID